MTTQKVTEVIDGDTFKTADETVRLANVDAPEKGQNGFEGAKNELRRLIEDKYVNIKEEARDDYGRVVAEVTVDGISVNAAMRRFLGQ